MLRRRQWTLLWVCSFLFGPVAVSGETLPQWSADFWNWRAAEQPFTQDDIPRIDRPAGFRIDWSPESVARRRKELTEWTKRWQALRPPAGAPIAEQVDYRLAGSAVARVQWELEMERSWQRNPRFYIDQTLGAVYVLLLPPPPFSLERQKEIVARMQSIPSTLAAARQNLTDMRRPFAELALESVPDLPARMQITIDELRSSITPENYNALTQAASQAVTELTAYRAWLKERLPQLREETAVGRENYLFFLRNVALLPFTPEELLSMSAQEWSRSVAFDTYEQRRNAGIAELPYFPDQAAQMAAEQKDEARIRAFLGAKQLLTVPASMKHYRNLPLPAYVKPFEELGVTDDLTGPDRLDQDGTSYIRQPGPQLGFFGRSTARDPRPIILHEGVPGHYFQLCLGWAHPDPVRRHYYDSNANEGIGFYAEELLLQAGLFDDSPKSREIIYSFMRLRALRVEVDVKLALGQFTLRQAAHYLNETVPMDQKTALWEAAMFASTPGQAITYQIGKIQIMNMLAAARRQLGARFSLQAFHDYVWQNGNVPLSLQRWELVGDESEVPPLN